MTLPTVDTVTNKFLYGMEDTPENLVDESLIRAANATGKQTIDVNEFMTDGAGKFALGLATS